MAYTPSTLENMYSIMDGVWKTFRYLSADSIATVLGSGYITDYKNHGMNVGDLVFVVDQSTPVLTMCKVASVNSTTGAATLTVANTVAGTFTNLTVTGNASLGDAAADLIALYGATPASQRAATVQALSLMSAGSYVSVTSNLAAILAEISSTLTALGAWKGAA